MYRKAITLISRHTREIMILFYAAIFIHFAWAVIRDAVGGCAAIDSVAFWFTGILSLLIIAGAFFLLFADHIRLDRILSGGKLSNILFIIAGILSVPLAMNFILSLVYQDTAGLASEMLDESGHTSGTSMLWTIFYHFLYNQSF